MDPKTSNYATALNIYKTNFETNYAKSRAPFGLYVHYHWFFKADSNPESYLI